MTKTQWHFQLCVVTNIATGKASLPSQTGKRRPLRNVCIPSWFPNEKISDYPLAIGNDITLIAGIQFRNNARALFMSSLSSLSNNIMQQPFILTWDAKNGRSDRIRSSNQKLMTQVRLFYPQENVSSLNFWCSRFSVGLQSLPVMYELYHLNTSSAVDHEVNFTISKKQLKFKWKWKSGKMIAGSRYQLTSHQYGHGDEMRFIINRLRPGIIPRRATRQPWAEIW